MNDLVIWGAGGVGRQVAQIVSDINSAKTTWNFIGYLDDKVNGSIAGVPVLGDAHWLSSNTHVNVAVAIGDSSARFKAYQRLKAIHHDRVATLVHPSVWEGARALVDQGSILYANVVLDPDVQIGVGAIVNKACSIGHDTCLGDFVSLAPGVNVGGAVRVGSGCYFGINSSTVQCISIGGWSVIGAGAVVIEDLPANATAVGVPARVTKRREKGWHL